MNTGDWLKFLWNNCQGKFGKENVLVEWRAQSSFTTKEISVEPCKILLSYLFSQQNWKLLSCGNRPELFLVLKLYHSHIFSLKKWQFSPVSLDVFKNVRRYPEEIWLIQYLVDTSFIVLLHLTLPCGFVLFSHWDQFSSNFCFLELSLTTLENNSFRLENLKWKLLIVWFMWNLVGTQKNFFY